MNMSRSLEIKKIMKFIIFIEKDQCLFRSCHMIILFVSNSNEKIKGKMFYSINQIIEYQIYTK